MQFVKISDLKAGMRLARPIYNKNGVLLFERDSKLTQQGIANISNFGLIGLFILEPAEPCPPMTPEDIEFERFQTINVFSLMDEISRINTQGKSAKFQMIVSNVIKSYGHMEDKINFNQNLRSEDDASYKHALNVAILSALMCNKLNLKVEERLDVVSAALIRGNLAPEVVDKFFSSNPNIKRYIAQADSLIEGAEAGAMSSNIKIMDGGRIIAVADVMDSMTAMHFEKTPESEVTTVRYLLDRADIFDKRVVDALVDSINILVPGVCVEFNTGSKALILSENKRDLFRPMVLCFDNNEIMDLSNISVFGDVEIKDIMKTMDNRHVMNTDMLNNMGV